MTKLKLHPAVIFRVPKFSYKDLLVDNWEELKETIKEASPEFYDIISNMNAADLAKADNKIKITARKYFNRASFRSTPFGTFAGLGVARMEWKKDIGVKLENGATIHTFYDWSERTAYDENNSSLHSKKMFFSNTSFYCVQSEIRYISIHEKQYVISAVNFDPFVLSILEFCSIPKRLDEIIGRYADRMDRNSIEEYIHDLIHLQLLLSSENRNIIGEDYFKRLAIRKPTIGKSYIITERKVETGTFDQGLFRYLPQLVETLQKVVSSSESFELTEFRERFIRKFEQAEIPLLLALDPETGVGYGNQEINTGSSAFIRKLQQVSQPIKVMANSALVEALYNEILSKTDGHQSIDLNDLVNEGNEISVLPNSINAVCTILDGNLYLETLGGVSGTSLAGRFALAIDDLKRYCREIAELEQAANPGVLFFDVGYTMETDVDNINRRPTIYNHQLNILNFDTSENPLGLHDLLVSVQNNEVVLRSKSLNRRVVPRLASAYNYKRSDLSVFRLLMDLQAQGLQTNLAINPSAIIPRLSYYPRIVYRNIIVSPASCVVKLVMVDKIEDEDARLKRLGELIQLRLNCSFIRTGTGDQTLCFDLNNRSDLEVLFSMLEKRKDMMVEEAGIPITPIIWDGQKPFLPQVIITLSHDQPVIRPVSKVDLKTVAKEWIALGKEWLYFEIYTSPFRSDQLLENKIRQYLTDHKRSISSWFFIRYNDNGEHIRLRIKLRDKRIGYMMMGKLTQTLDEELQSGTISDLRLGTYKKEVHRYSASMMNKVEEHFHTDSNYVLGLLGKRHSDNHKYNLCLQVLENLRLSSTISYEIFDDLVMKATGSLNKEHQLDNQGFKELNKVYKEFKSEPYPNLSSRILSKFKNFNNSFVRLLNTCPEEMRPQLLADLFHMHVNRLFSNNQRSHEMMIYNFYAIILKANQYSGNHTLNRA